MRSLSHTMLLLIVMTATIGSQAHGQPAVQFVEEMQDWQWITQQNITDLSYNCIPTSPAQQAQWETTYPFIAKQIDDNTVVRLSRWARQETESFQFTVGATPTLEPYRCNDQWTIFRARLAVLPSHTPIVFRFLDVFMISPNYDDGFFPNEFIVTIRGYVLE